MNMVLGWLGKNRTINVLLVIIVYFSIVTFHDEITQLAVQIRKAIGRDQYNAYLSFFFLFLLLLFIAWLGWNANLSYRKKLKFFLLISITVLMLSSFRLLMTYNIEAIHFVEYAILAILLLPLLRSYGETVFWATILGLLDELFQYFFLVPEFGYFDFNDNVLNLLGAGAGAIMAFIFNEHAIRIKKIIGHRSPAVLTGLFLLAFFLTLYLTGLMTFNPTGLADSGNWFSLNREAVGNEFWTEAYPGRRFHILRPWEGMVVIYALFAGFFLLDKTRVHSQ